GKRGEGRRLLQREVRGRLVEVGPGGRLHAVCTVPEVDMVQVQLEDLVLGELALDLAGDARLQDLASQVALGVRQPLREEIPRELLRDGATPLLRPARPRVAGE